VLTKPVIATMASSMGATQKCRIDQIKSTQGLDTDGRGAFLTTVNTENGEARTLKKGFLIIRSI